MRDIFYTDYRHCLFFIRYKKDNNIITEYIEKFNFDVNLTHHYHNYFHSFFYLCEQM